MFDSLLKTVAVLFIFSARSAFKVVYHFVATVLNLWPKPTTQTPGWQVTDSAASVKVSAPVAPQSSASDPSAVPLPSPGTPPVRRRVSPYGQRTISERPAGDPEVLFAYATARRSGLVGRHDPVGKAQLLALPARMAVQWRRFQPLQVADPKYRLHAVGKKSVLAIDTSDMSPEGLDEVYRQEVKPWRPSPSHTPPASWVDHPYMIYPEVVIHAHLAKQFRLDLPTWIPLQVAQPVSQGELLEADNHYWVLTMRGRRRYDPPSGSLIEGSKTP